MKINWRRIMYYPIPGIDAQWLMLCSSERCKNDMTLHASWHRLEEKVRWRIIEGKLI